MSPFILISLQFTVLVYAVIGGVFLAFSDFIMRSLALSPEGAVTMQMINHEVFRWIFMALFLALTPLSLCLILYGFISVGGTAGYLIAFAGLVYLIGCFGVTAGLNVPMNNALAELSVGSPELSSYWQNAYVPLWTFWNSIRTGACLVAAAMLSFALTLLVTS